MFEAFDEAFPKMSVGERATLTCSPDVAYGPNGLPPRIPPNSTVIFEAHLLEVKWSRRAEPPSTSIKEQTPLLPALSFSRQNLINASLSSHSLPCSVNHFCPSRFAFRLIHNLLLWAPLNPKPFWLLIHRTHVVSFSHTVQQQRVSLNSILKNFKSSSSLFAFLSTHLGPLM